MPLETHMWNYTARKRGTKLQLQDIPKSDKTIANGPVFFGPIGKPLEAANQSGQTSRMGIANQRPASIQTQTYQIEELLYKNNIKN
jgi:hypothetical protein